MKQNKYFNSGRFARLFRNDLLINQKTYMFAIAGISIALYLFSYFIMRSNNGSFHRTEDYIPLVFMYLMAIGVAIGTSFPALKDQIKLSNYLLAPGSTFEKFMVQFVIRIILFIPIALFLFWVIMHLTKATMFPNPERGFDPSLIVDFHFSDLFKNGPGFRDRVVIFVSIFSLASLLFAGSAYFNRFALVKTIIITVAVIFLVIMSFVGFSHIFYPAETHGFDMKLKMYEITHDINNVQLAAYLLGCLSWIFFLALAYFKLKEKEV